MRKWIIVPAVLAMLAAAGCTGDEGGDGDAKEGGPSVIAPGKPGESNRTLSPDEAKASVPNVKPNEADFTFIQDMIVHHSQAIEMTDLAAKSAVAPKVKAIADRIHDSQAPEIDAMNRWLELHGKEPIMVPGAKGFDENEAHEHGAEHSHEGMPGMATEAQMEQLGAVRGAKFDQLFLQLMIKHHEGALTMAAEVQQKGADGRVQEIADHVISSQSAEIGRMKQMQQPG